MKFKMSLSKRSRALYFMGSVKVIMIKILFTSFEIYEWNFVMYADDIYANSSHYSYYLTKRKLCQKNTCFIWWFYFKTTLETKQGTNHVKL